MLMRHTQCLKAVLLSALSLVAGVEGQAQRADTQELVFRLESFNISLDPAFISDTQSRRLVDMLHAKLVSSGPDGGPKPELAQQWAWMTPTVLRLTLSSGYKFSNGRPVTAADAVFSLCRLVQPGAPYGWLFSNLQHVVDTVGKKADCTGLRAIDDLTLEIAVASDPGRLLPALASSTAAIVPAGSTPGEFGIVAGAGPYQVDRVVANSRVELSARPGGPLEPKAKRVIFQLVQDDATAATLFKTGDLDAMEIANPTLYKLLIDSSGRLTVPGRLAQTDSHQIRLLIFDNAAIARTLGFADEEAQQWVRAYTTLIDSNELSQRFAPLAIPMRTSYFPARNEHQRKPYTGPVPKARGALQVISENDPYSSAIAAALPGRFGSVNLDYVGLEKSVLISRLLKKEYDVASITLEAMMNHPAYWLAFFEPGSPFTIFGGPVQGLELANSSSASNTTNAAAIDERSNWFILFQERHLLALQPNMAGESFLATGLVNYSTMGKRQ